MLPELLFALVCILQGWILALTVSPGRLPLRSCWTIPGDKCCFVWAGCQNPAPNTQYFWVQASSLLKSFMDIAPFMPYTFQHNSNYFQPANVLNTPAGVDWSKQKTMERINSGKAALLRTEFPETFTSGWLLKGTPWNPEATVQSIKGSKERYWKYLRNKAKTKKQCRHLLTGKRKDKAWHGGSWCIQGFFIYKVPSIEKWLFYLKHEAQYTRSS